MNNPSDIDIVFKLKENKKRFTLGSTINKQGKIGFEASAFFPNLLGTLSTSKFSMETFGTNSREININHFAPRIFSSNIDMSYNLSKSIVDYNKSSFYTESSFGGLVRFSNPNNRHNFTIESRIRNFPGFLHEKTDKMTHEHNSTNSSGVFGSQDTQTTKNSISYSWNKVKSNYYDTKEDDCSSTKTKSFSNSLFKINYNKTIQQLSIELAGFSGDVSFIKTQGFFTWSSKFSRIKWGTSLLKYPNLDFCFGFGSLFPNFLDSSKFKTSIHDKFFLGGNSGAHFCLPGFAPRSVGPCTNTIEANGKEGNSIMGGNKENVYIGGNTFISSELRVSHPLDLSNVGIDVKPSIQAFVNSAIVLDKNDYYLEKQSLFERFKQNMRAATGFGFSVPLGPADLNLSFSTPIRCQSTDILEGFQLGMRMTYAPL